MVRTPKRSVLDEMEDLEQKRKQKKQRQDDDEDLDLGKVWS